jgi:hypothetical protein
MPGLTDLATFYLRQGLPSVPMHTYKHHLCNTNRRDSLSYSPLDQAFMLCHQTSHVHCNPPVTTSFLSHTDVWLSFHYWLCLAERKILFTEGSRSTWLLLKTHDTAILKTGHRWEHSKYLVYLFCCTYTNCKFILLIIRPHTRDSWRWNVWKCCLH